MKQLDRYFLQMKSCFTDEQLERFAACQHPETEYFFGLGNWIRSKLQNDTALQDAFVKAGISHPDDMSAQILRMFHHSLTKDSK